jgi:hypothetical protein
MGVEPQREAEGPQEDAETTIVGVVHWSSSGVVITLPDVENSQPTSVTWDDDVASSNGSGGYASTVTRESNNTISATYPAGVYAAGGIPRGATRVQMHKG